METSGHGDALCFALFKVDCEAMLSEVLVDVLCVIGNTVGKCSVCGGIDEEDKVINP